MRAGFNGWYSPRAEPARDEVRRDQARTPCRAEPTGCAHGPPEASGDFMEWSRYQLLSTVGASPRRDAGMIRSCSRRRRRPLAGTHGMPSVMTISA